MCLCFRQIRERSGIVVVCECCDGVMMVVDVDGLRTKEEERLVNVEIRSCVQSAGVTRKSEG
jgi:hypothetical protein